MSPSLVLGINYPSNINIILKLMAIYVLENLEFTMPSGYNQTYIELQRNAMLFLSAVGYLNIDSCVPLSFKFGDLIR